MAIDLTSFSNALDRLHEGMERYGREPNDAQLRDGVIQRFEFTYDLAVKTLRRVVEAASEDPALVGRMTFGEMVRTADDLGMTPLDWPAWKHWRDLRNITSHTYDEIKAKEVVAKIPDFASSMTAMLSRIQARLWAM